VSPIILFCLLGSALGFQQPLHGESISYITAQGAAATIEWPENHEIRNVLQGTMFSPGAAGGSSFTGIHEQHTQSHRVKFDVERSADAVYYLFVNEEEYRFPVYSRGSYVVKKGTDGVFRQVKIFLGSDQGNYLRVFPDGTRSRIDAYLFERKLYGNVVVPLPFERVLTESFAELVRLTGRIIDWNLLAPRTDDPGYARLGTTAAAIRKMLPRLRDADDGAMDADGVFVTIADGKPQPSPGGFNCSGFAKWVADGVLRAAVGRLFSIEELAARHPGYRGNRWSEPLEHVRDPYFGLDWTRNIAVGLEHAGFGEDPQRQGRPGDDPEARTAAGPQRQGRQAVDPEAMDVREGPFARYVEDVGYTAADLPIVLYYLAVTEPGWFYLASVNKEFGADPRLRQHTHVAVLLPYFTAGGRFVVNVFETNREHDFSSFLSYNKEFDLHLVRIRARDTFELPGIE
jgi:hypothetical protein